jgi:hypothetical protein
MTFQVWETQKPEIDQSGEATEGYTRRTKNTINAITRIKRISPPPIYMSTAFHSWGLVGVHIVGFTGGIFTRIPRRHL